MTKEIVAVADQARRQPTAEQVAAARLRLALDVKLGRKTPQRILKILEEVSTVTNQNLIEDETDRITDNKTHSLDQTRISKRRGSENESDHVVIDVSNLTLAYTGNNSDAVLDDISFTILRGQTVCIVGENGSGKTTLVKCLIGQLSPTSGSVSVEGENPYKTPPAGLSLVLQEFGRSLFPWLTVGKNVEFPLKRQGLSRDDRRAKVHESLSLVGLEAHANKLPSELSGGMQQRVAIARALVTKPKLLIMDEPFSVIDANLRPSLQERLLALVEEWKSTLLFVTNDVNEAVRLGQRIFVMTRNPGATFDEVMVANRVGNEDSVHDYEIIRESVARLLGTER